MSSRTPCYVISKAAGKCVEPYSVVYMCDEFEARLTGRNESDFTNVPFVLNTIQSMAPAELQMFLGKDSVITATTASSTITRAVLFFGKPLAGYKNTFDRSDAQDATIRSGPDIALLLYNNNNVLLLFYYYHII